MDFLARAGAIIDRAHRVAGFLLVLCGVLGLVTMCQMNEITNLNSQLKVIRQQLPVIVVPGALAGEYDPREEERLISNFTDFITQSFNNYTPETLVKQLEASQPFMSPQALIDGQSYFEKKISDASTIKRSMIFIPERTTLQVKKYRENGVDMRDVLIQGTIQQITSGLPVEALPVEIAMKIRRTIINPKVNPYGFILESYSEKALAKLGSPEPERVNPSQQ